MKCNLTIAKIYYHTVLCCTFILHEWLKQNNISIKLLLIRYKMSCVLLNKIQQIAFRNDVPQNENQTNFVHTHPLESCLKNFEIVYILVFQLCLEFHLL